MSSKFLSLLLLVISCHGSPVAEKDDSQKPAGLTTYDQRQTGKYNVHVNIKDVQFFSVSDSLAGIGGDYEEGDYGDYEDVLGGFGDNDYDSSHLTVNPIFAFLGSKPTTPKPTTETPLPSTEKLPPSSSSSSSESDSIATQETSTQKSSTSTNAPKQESQESEIKDSEVHLIKPASTEDKKPQQVNGTIDYEEIPVEVLYYRANQQQKLPLNSRQHGAINRFHKRPSVVVIDGHGRTNNVKILGNERSPTVKICNRGEFRDNLGRCRVRARRGAAPAGLRRLFNLFSGATKN